MRLIYKEGDDYVKNRPIAQKIISELIVNNKNLSDINTVQ